MSYNCSVSFKEVFFKVETRNIVLSGAVLFSVIGSVEVANGAVLNQEMKSELGGGNHNFRSSLAPLKGKSEFAEDAITQLPLGKTSKPGLLQHDMRKTAAMSEDLGYLSTEGDMAEDDLEEQNANISDNSIELYIVNENKVDKGEEIRTHKTMISVLDEFKDDAYNDAKNEDINENSADKEYDFDIDDDPEYDEAVRKHKDMMKRGCEDKKEYSSHDTQNVEEFIQPAEPQNSGRTEITEQHRYRVSSFTMEFSPTSFTMNQSGNMTFSIVKEKDCADDDIYRQLYEVAMKKADETWKHELWMQQLSWFERTVYKLKKSVSCIVHKACTTLSRFASKFTSIFKKKNSSIISKRIRGEVPPLA